MINNNDFPCTRPYNVNMRKKQYNLCKDYITSPAEINDWDKTIYCFVLSESI